METELGKILSSISDLPLPECTTHFTDGSVWLWILCRQLNFLIFIHSSYWVFKKKMPMLLLQLGSVLSSARFQQSTTPPWWYVNKANSRRVIGKCPKLGQPFCRPILGLTENGSSERLGRLALLIVAPKTKHRRQGMCHCPSLYQW